MSCRGSAPARKLLPGCSGLFSAFTFALCELSRHCCVVLMDIVVKARLNAHKALNIVYPVMVVPVLQKGG